MKYYMSYFILTILAVCLLTACKDTAPYLSSGGDVYIPALQGRYLSVSPSSLVFEAKPVKAAEVGIVSEDTPWQISGATNWLSLSPASGSNSAKVGVDAQENVSADTSRSCVILVASTVSDYQYSKNISVTQTYATPYIRVLPDKTLMFTGASDYQTITVDANYSWTASYPESESWITFSPTYGMKTDIKVNVSENRTGKQRTVYITLKDKAGKTTEKVTVNQAAAKVIPSTATTLNFENIGGTKSFSFTSEASWSVDKSHPWITVTPASGIAGGSLINITLSPSDTDQPREGTVTIKIGDTAVQQIKVVQGGNYITPDQTIKDCPGSAGYFEIPVSANVEWTPSTTCSWIMNVKREGNKVVFDVEENPTCDIRHGVIKLVGGNIESQIQVNQQPGGMDIDNYTLNFSNKGGKYTAQLDTDVSWTAETTESWIEVDPERGEAGSTPVTISVTPNGTVENRTGYVNFKKNGITALTVTVQQDGNFVRITEQQLMFSSSEESKELRIESNTSWEVLEQPEWLTVKPSSGKDTLVVNVTSTDNPFIEPRNGVLVIGQRGTTLSQTVSVSQEGKYFHDLIGSLSFPDTVCSQTLEIETDGHWRAYADGFDWIIPSPSEGGGSATLTVSVTENTSDEERTGNLNIQVGNTVKAVLINQTGKYFSVNPTSSPSIPSRGGTHEVEIVTNESWSAASNSSWITLNPQSGHGSAMVSITAGDNPSVNQRSDTTIITPANLKPIKVVTVQAARYLRLDANSLSFFAKGGMSAPFSVETDGNFTVTTEAGWLHIDHDGKTFTITADANKDRTRQAVVRIALSDLVAGEEYYLDLTVEQRNGCNVADKDSYLEDENWNNTGDANITLTITGFSEDENWNNKGENSLKVTIIGFSEDENWNNKGGINLGSTVTGFSEDENWNNRY